MTLDTVSASWIEHEMLQIVVKAVHDEMYSPDVNSPCLCFACHPECTPGATPRSDARFVQIFAASSSACPTLVLELRTMSFPWNTKVYYLVVGPSSGLILDLNPWETRRCARVFDECTPKFVHRHRYAFERFFQ